MGGVGRADSGNRKTARPKRAGETNISAQKQPTPKTSAGPATRPPPQKKTNSRKTPKGFRDETFNILIATDVAGRGIDVPGIALVINYDMPAGIEAYTHRWGALGVEVF